MDHLLVYRQSSRRTASQLQTQHIKHGFDKTNSDLVLFLDPPLPQWFRSLSKLPLVPWSILSNTYAKPTRGHIKQIKAQVKNVVKGSQSISEYMEFVKNRADELVVLGKPLDREDLIETILDGLDYDYKAVVDAITTVKPWSPLMSFMRNSLRGNSHWTCFTTCACIQLRQYWCNSSLL